MCGGQPSWEARKLWKMAHKKDEDVDGFYKSECKITVISREHFTSNPVSVRARCMDEDHTRLCISGQFNKWLITKLSQKLSILGMTELHKEKLRSGPAEGGGGGGCCTLSTPSSRSNVFMYNSSLMIHPFPGSFTQPILDFLQENYFKVTMQ